MKKYLSDKDLKDKWLSGAKKLSDIVGQTLGPNGKFVALSGYKPKITKDGVSVAKDFELEDPFENSAVQLIRESALKTNEVAGDSTTTSTILSYELLKAGYSLIEKGLKANDVAGLLKEIGDYYVNQLKEKALPMSEELIKSVATISANNDEKLGELISEAFKKVGKDGIVNVETTRGVETSIDISEGLEFDEGWLSSYFVNNREKAEVNFEDALILVTNKKINRIEEISGFLETSIRENKPLFVICEELEGEALNTTVINILNGIVKFAAVKCPFYGQRKIDFLNDISVLTGATFVSEESGIRLQDCGSNFLGSAKNIKSSKSKTFIINGGGDKEILAKYIEDLNKQIDTLDSPKDKENMRKRISKFSGSAATIKVGAKTDVEAAEIRDRVDDAVSAVKSAFELGVIPGGGIALYKINAEAENTFTSDSQKEISSCFNAIFNKIANQKLPSNILEEDFFFGLNAKTQKTENLLEAGVIDSAKSVSEAIKNAVSVVSTMLNTNSIIVNISKEEK